MNNKNTRYLLFALGAALGSALGLILGSLLTFWIGEEPCVRSSVASAG